MGQSREKPMSIFFSADFHFGHSAICRYCSRPYENVDEMDSSLIANWNKDVHDNDDVYVLGDFAFQNPMKYLSCLKGNIHILPGSHDRLLKGSKFAHWLMPPMVTLSPQGLQDEYGKQRQITLCHYAMRSWPKSHFASWHLFGHSHNKLEPYGLSFDVGVDGHSYHLWSLEQVAERMKTLRPIIDLRK